MLMENKVCSRNFYPRPHMEGDRRACFVYRANFPISTHALTWRATLGKKTEFVTLWISTHALTWRATRQDREKNKV